MEKARHLMSVRTRNQRRISFLELDGKPQSHESNSRNHRGRRTITKPLLAHSEK